MLCGALPTAEWFSLYKRAYHNLVPGGWIEHFDTIIDIRCDDGSLPADSLLADWGAKMAACVASTGNPTDVSSLMRPGIEAAGFINIHEKDFKVPIGDWPRHPIYKEVGDLRLTQFKEGLTGWVMWALTSRCSSQWRW